MSRSFAVTFDYRCPFARNVHEHLLTALEAGADWDVRFLPFSLDQAHVAEGEPSVWDEPAKSTGIVALQAGIWVRDNDPAHFYAVHRALFAARHDQSLQLKDPEVVRKVLADNGADPDAVFAAIDDGTVLKTVEAEHEGFVTSHSVWGVPTFIVGDQAVFVRVMDRSKAAEDSGHSTSLIERVVDQVTGWPELNEFKHTSIPR